MLIIFPDDYQLYIQAAYDLIGVLNYKIATAEPFLGDNKKLDNLYAQSILVYGIAYELDNTSHKKPLEDQKLLMCLQSLLKKHNCPIKHNPVKYKERYPVDPSLIPSQPLGGIIEVQDTFLSTELNEILIYND